MEWIPKGKIDKDNPSDACAGKNKRKKKQGKNSSIIEMRKGKREVHDLFTEKGRKGTKGWVSQFEKKTDNCIPNKSLNLIKPILNPYMYTYILHAYRRLGQKTCG